MGDKTSAESLPQELTGAESNQAAPATSAEVTTAYDPAARNETPSDSPAPPIKLPVTEAEGPDSLPDRSLPFLQPGKQPGSLGRLGHFELLKMLGRGGFGIVFKALDEKLERLVAIKMLSAHLAGNPEARSRFVREARAAAAVNCKYVVSTYEVYEQPIPYLVMEYIDGKTLQDRIDQAGALHTGDILRIGAEIAAGLAAAHKQGLIHRDIKPANVLLDGVPHERVKIADFGLARAVDDASLTRTGVVAGTPLFMSPEQAYGEALDHRSDLFSLGSVLYTLCTGQTPFRPGKPLGVLKRVCNDTPRPIREINAGIPEALAAVVHRLLEKDPADRFQTAAEVAGLFEQQLTHLDDPALSSRSGVLVGLETTDHVPYKPGRADTDSPPSEQPRSRRKWFVAAAVLLLPALALTLTEIAGLTHLFRAKPDDEAPFWAAMPGKLLVPNSGKPIEKDPPIVAPAADDHPFKKATVGDFVEYKMTQDSIGENIDGKVTLEVIARTETTARLKTTVRLFGRDTGAPDIEIDLAKPFDPTVAILPSGAAGRFDKVDSGKEKLKVGGSEYETSWIKMKLTTKRGNLDVEETAKYWTSRSVPLGGLVRMEASRLVKRAATTVAESKVTLELTGSGHKISPAVARNLAARGDHGESAASYARVFAAQPLEDGEHGFEYACVLVLAGDIPGYRKFCAEMLELSGQRDVRPYHVARSCTLAPDSVLDPALPGIKADAELKRNNWTFWSLTEQGALAYRAGRFDEAVPLFERSIENDSKPARAVLNWLWLSMAELRRGKPAEARAWLEKATKWIEQYPQGPVVPDDSLGAHLHNWMEAQILYREAKALFDVAMRFPALLRGEDTPKDNKERLAFAQFAYDQKKFAGAARLWADALASDPKLGDDRLSAPRFSAARAAILAAGGQAKDEPSLDDAAKAKLRGQALNWLKAELKAWDDFLESGPPENRATIAQALSCWPKHADLAGIRDAALARLPADEQKSFTQLWADAAALARKAEEKPK